jgi:hypothetical protein
MPENLPGGVTGTFPAEFRSLWSLCLLSLVLGGLALALGLRFIVTAVAAVAGTGTFDAFRLVEALAGWAATVIGFRWVLSAVRILSGASGILRDYQALEGSAGGEADAIPPGALEALVLRMMDHYRKNWKAWWKMPLVSTLGGWILVFLGVLFFIEGYPAWQAGGGPSLPFVAGGIAVALGIGAVLVSSRFRTLARTWEHRLIEAGQADELLEPGAQGSS